MLHADRYGLFAKMERGPLCRDFMADLEEAKQKAQNLAEEEGCEYFVFDFSASAEVAHLWPPERREN